MIIAGDIGGTNSRLAFFDASQTRLNPLGMKIYPSRQFQGLPEILALFLQEMNITAETACIGIAGPVDNNRCITPNLPWTVDGHSAEKALDCPVTLINDLEATAYGVSELQTEEFLTLQPGDATAGGNAVLIAPGTGLGQAALIEMDGKLMPVATEGGHADFAPRNNLEVELLFYLKRIYHRVSVERVLSGPGIVSIYTFLREHLDFPETTFSVDFEHQDPAPIIAEAALQGTDPLCLAVMNLFVSILGAEAGNLALKFKATRGVYVAGGIPPRILPLLETGKLQHAFNDKGRMSSMVEKMPVRVILNDLTAMLGAARCALKNVKDQEGPMK